MSKEQTKVVNLRKKPYDVYIGRGKNGKNMFTAEIKERGWLGNPFKIEEAGGDYTREESIRKFKEAFKKKLKEDKKFKKAVKKLKGKTLGCFCKPKACHGDILVEYLEEVKK